MLMKNVVTLYPVISAGAVVLQLCGHLLII